MIMVLGRAVKESEAESRLHALREGSLARQTHGKRPKDQPDPMKVYLPARSSLREKAYFRRGYEVGMPLCKSETHPILKTKD